MKKMYFFRNESHIEMKKIWKKSVSKKKDLETKNNELMETYNSLLQIDLKDQNVLMKER